MATTYNDHELRWAVDTVRHGMAGSVSVAPVDLRHAANLLADYTEATLNLSDEVDGR